MYVRRMRMTAAGLAAAAALAAVPESRAAEAASGFYLLGQRSNFAAALPPPGVFFQLDGYFYGGDAGAATKFPSGGELRAGIDGFVALGLPTLIVTPDAELLGGRPMFTLTAPFGSKSLDFNAAFDNGGNQISGSGSRDDVSFGDPVAAATMGWTDGGKWQGTASLSVNVPIGEYHTGNPANIAFHYWGFDTTAAVTWFDPDIGLEASGAYGFTFNLENPDTDYKTGTEMHLELGVSQSFPNKLSIGAVGYYYQQITGDSGSGATLGSFKGRIFGVGPSVSYVAQVGPLPVSLHARWYYEFGAQNRLEGNAGYVGLSIPLAVFGGG